MRARSVLQLPRRAPAGRAPRVAHGERSALDDRPERWPARLSYAYLAKALLTSYPEATGTALLVHLQGLDPRMDRKASSMRRTRPRASSRASADFLKRSRLT